MPKFVWKRVAITQSLIGYVGKIHIFTISYRLTKAIDDPDPWVLRSGLPGHKDLFVHGKTESELMTKATKIFDEWLEQIGVKECPEK